MPTKSNTNDFHDFRVNVRIRLSGLWTSVMFCYIYGDYFKLYVPGTVNGLISGHNMVDNPSKLFAAAFMMTIPALMISLSLVLKPKINRLLNIIFGTVFTAVMLLIAIFSFEKWLSFYLFLALAESILTLIIVWQAVTWTKAN